MAESAAAYLANRRQLLLRLQTKLHEKAILLATLELWQDIEELGIDPNTVVSFGFNPDKLHRSTLRRLWQAPTGGFGGSNRNHPSDGNPFFAPLPDSDACRVRWYNVVKLKDGTEVVLQDALLAPEDRVEKHWNSEVGKCPPPSTPVTGSL